MRLKNWEKIAGGRSGLILICALTTLSLVLVLEHILNQGQLLIGTNKFNMIWGELIIDLVLISSIGIISLSLVRTAESKRSKAERTLSYSEERYKELFENSPLGIYRTTPNGQILLANSALIQMLGYSSFKELAKRNLEKEGFEPDYPRRQFKEIMEKEGEVKGLESAWIKRDRTTLFIRENAKAIRDENGKILYYEGTTEDITVRKKAESELEESRQKYIDLFESAPDSIVTLDLKGFITSCNEAAAKLPGYPKEELIGKHFTDLGVLKISYIPQYLKLFSSILKGEIPEPIEVDFIHKDGTLYTVESQIALLKEDGRTTGIQVFTRDITERKKAEEALRDSEQRYKLLFEKNLAGVYRTTLDGKMIDCNESFARLLGYDSAEDVMTHQAVEFYFEDDERKEFLSLLQKKGNLNDFEICMRRRDGKPVWILENVTLIEDVKSGHVYIQGTSIDITGRKQAEQVQTVLFNIANATNTTKNIQELFQSIQRELGKLMDTTNLFIALYDKKTDTISLPYHVDEKDRLPFFPTGKTLTSYIIRTEKPLLVTQELRNRLIQSGEIEIFGTPSKIWLGVPLKIGEEVIGVVTVQSYTDLNAYGEREMKILEFVSRQIALAIERKKAEEALKESEEKYRSLVERANDGIAIIQNLELKYLNPSLAKMMGYTVQEMMGTKATDYPHPDELPKLVDMYNRRMAGENVPNIYETTLLSKEGNKLNVEVNIGVISYMGESADLVIYRDITERKKAEEALKESEDKFKTLSEESFDSIIIHDVNEVLEVNRAFTRVWGYEPDEVRGISVKKFITLESYELVLEKISSGYEKPYEISAIKKDGTVFPIEIAGRQINYKDKKVRIVTARDITERKRAEEERVQHTKNMEFLSETAMGFVDLPAEKDIYRFIGEQLRELTNDALYVLVNSFDQKTREIQVRALLADDQHIQAVLKTLGTDPKGMSFVLSEEAWNGLISGKLVHVPGGIYELSFGEIPKSACDALEKLAGTGDIFTMGFTKKGELYGSASIIMREGSQLSNQDVIEIFVRQAGVALQRKLAEEALRAERDKLETVTQNMGAGMAIISRDYRTVWANKVLRQIFGEVEGKSCYSTYNQNPDICPECGVRKVFETGIAQVIHEQAGKDKDGNTIWSQIIATSIRDKEGNITAALEMVVPITERKRAEIALRESEERFRQFAENIDQVFWLTDWDAKKLLYVNPAYERLYGRSCQSAYEDRKSWQDVIHPEDRTRISEAFARSADLGQYIEAEYRIVRDDGTVRWVLDRSYPIRDKYGRIYRFASVADDITGRKKAEEALKASESKYKTLLENLPQKIFFKDKNLVYVSCNKNYARDLKILPDEITGKTDYDFYPEELAEKYRADDERIMQTGKTEDLEEEYIQDGQEVFVNTVKTPVKNEKGDIIGVLGVFWDITERKRAEERLKAEKEFSEKLISTTNAIIVGLDKEHKIMLFSEGAERITGYLRKEVMGKDWFRLFFKDEMYQEMLEVWKDDWGKDLHSYINPIYSKNRKEIVAQWSNTSIKNAEGEPIMLLCIAVDITERKKAEELLRTSQAQLSNAMKIAKLGYWEYDVAKDLFTFDDHFYAIFRTTAEKVGGYKMSSARYAELFVHPDDRSLVGIEIQKALKTNDPQFSRQLEHRIIYAGGVIGYITVRFFIVKDNKGNTVMTYGANQDITERKKLQDQLIQTEKLAAVGTLAYGIAHEFNNILAGMLANAELGLVTDEPRQIKECFEIIADNSHRAASITNNLLAFARQKEARKELIDITEPLRSVLAVTRRDLEKLNLEIVEKFKSVPRIYCDSGQLSEVFLNMITNARDAMREKGGVLNIQVETDRDNIRIIFKDTGCGIPEEIKGKIFEPFVTSKGALGGSEIPGTGLGLFLSYGIIDGYQGKIEVESKMDKGTTFTIIIPVSKNQLPESLLDAKIKHSEKVDKKLKILLVDDEQTIVSGLKKFLESKGHRVTTSLRGKEGLKLFKKDTFDLVLSDITMPDMDGIELIKKIKEQNQKTKIIVITGHIMQVKENEAWEAGADEVLIKPFKNEVLCLAISKLMMGIQGFNK